MIIRLNTVGFNATELSRMSNENLHATYVTARPLLEKNAAELQKVMERERKRSQRLRAEIAGEQYNRQAAEEYHQWSQNHLPKPIVARRADMMGESMPQNPEVEMVASELRVAKQKLREAQRDLRFRGGRDNIAKVEHARKKVELVEDWMQEVSK